MISIKTNRSVQCFAGTPGTAAALMATSDESVPKPTRLRAVTLKVYKTSVVRELAVYDVAVIPEASTEYAPSPILRLIR